MSKENTVWYAVRALYVSEVRGGSRARTRGLLEERVLLIKSTARVALKAATKAARAREHSYKNANGEIITWKLQQVLDVSKVLETAIRPGTEVYGRFHHNATASATIKRLGFHPDETLLRH